MGGHAGNMKDFVKESTTPLNYMYDPNRIVTLGVLPCDLVSGETMTWDMEHVLDVQILNSDTNKRYCSTT